MVIRKYGSTYSIYCSEHCNLIDLKDDNIIQSYRYRDTSHTSNYSITSPIVLNKELVDVDVDVDVLDDTPLCKPVISRKRLRKNNTYSWDNNNKIKINNKIKKSKKNIHKKNKNTYQFYENEAIESGSELDDLNSDDDDDDDDDEKLSGDFINDGAYTQCNIKGITITFLFFSYNIIYLSII